MASGVAARRMDAVETPVHVSSPRFALMYTMANFRKVDGHIWHERGDEYSSSSRLSRN
jgi:hypothetical protein